MEHIYEIIAEKAGETPEQIRSQIEEALQLSKLPPLPPELIIIALARIAAGEGRRG